MGKTTVIDRNEQLELDIANNNVLINKKLIAAGKVLLIRANGCHTMNLKVPELREELRERGLKTSGNFRELMKRIKKQLGVLDG